MYDTVEQYCIDNRDRLYRLAYSYTRNRDDALDVVSESVLKALQNKKKMNNEKAIRTWLYRIVVNTALDLFKKNKYADNEFALQHLTSEDTIPDCDLHNTINALPEPEHSIIVLRFFEDMKISEVAHVLNLNENSVKTRLYATLRKLKIEMAEDEPVTARDSYLELRRPL